MGSAELGTLAVLALVDGTSIGTLAIPVWLLLSPKVHARRVAAYLAAVALLYAAIGAVLLVAGLQIASVWESWTEHPATDWTLLVLGAGLFALSFVVDRGPAHRESREASNQRIARWRARAVAAVDSTRGVGTLALVAVATEAVTMLPYLAAMGIIVASGLSWAASLPLVLGYCLIMVAPAAILLVLRVAARERVAPVLEFIDRWLDRNAAQMLGLLLGVAGFFIAAGAVQRLELVG